MRRTFLLAAINLGSFNSRSGTQLSIKTPRGDHLTAVKTGHLGDQNGHGDNLSGQWCPLEAPRQPRKVVIPQKNHVTEVGGRGAPTCLSGLE